MKTYDFDALMDRHGWDSIAVDAVGHPAYAGFAPSTPKEGYDEIPMWVADMNLPTAASITDAIVARAQHPAFGYFSPKMEYYEAIINWHKKIKHVDDIKLRDIGYENGVLGGIISALRVFGVPGDKVLVHSPTYMGFTRALTKNGFNIVHSPLVRDENGVWRMDYADMDRKIRENHIHAAIFCNPHNPCGRVWTEEEIQKAMEVYEKNHVWVISDEIWSDLMMNGNIFTASQSVSEWAHDHVVAFYAPSKTFNLAGLIGSYSVIYNKDVRERVHEMSARLVYNEMNVLSEHALIGAYSEEGENWLRQVLQVLSENVNLGYDAITTRCPGVTTFRTEGTYMMFLDCSDYLSSRKMSQQELLRKGWDYGVGWQDGHLFEAPDCIRLNLASPTARIREAFDRMEKLIFA
ncbi:MAG: aminotransferase class I/II-fold pyridoxal phosphate-dependent enzyme [Lachnospiraceae bacterium]|nr:aminotransferase class I/II-fold pyridoxal phosphate-dependent enzyme [Lachnospiraceae bacterium]